MGADKEKPLLTVQGILRLERCFVTAQHEDAEKMTIKPSENEEAKEIRLVPGDSEHENIKYKLGYDIGPSNPNPTNKEEERIFKEQRAEEAKQDRFEEMKKQSEAEKEELKQKFRRENELKPPGDDPDNDDETNPTKKINPEELDP